MFGEPVQGGPAGGRTRARLVGAVVAVVVLAGSAVVGVVGVTSTRSFFPSRWDPQVGPIADTVARLRGLEFEHPVAVHYLAPKDFERQLSSGGVMSATDRQDAANEEAVLRAVGLIGGKVDLVKAAETSETSSVLAYYDDYEKQIFVRGTTLDVAHRVTLAHELTHVLQDQHFDLTALKERADRSGEGEPFRALVEGDAVRIEDSYREGLSAADQREFEREDQAEGDRVTKETADVPDIVTLLFGAPYAYGPESVRVIFADGGNRAVDDALQAPAPSSAVFVQAGMTDPPVAVTEPLPPAGATSLGDSEAFDAFEMLLTLSTRLSADRALEAADVVAGGRALAFRSDREVCYRVVVAPASASARPFLARAVADWARGRVRTAVDSAGDDVGFTVCDPGKSAPDPPTGAVKAVGQLLGVRTSLTAIIAKDGGVSADMARCIARVFVQTPGAADLLVTVGDDSTSPQAVRLQSIAAESRRACDNDVDSGLP